MFSLCFSWANSAELDRGQNKLMGICHSAVRHAGSAFPLNKGRLSTLTKVAVKVEIQYSLLSAFTFVVPSKYSN